MKKAPGKKGPVSKSARMVHRVEEMQRMALSLRGEGKTIAVVPTMGALHEGHRSLIHLAANHADVVVTSVFVNPTQFGTGDDFDRYPRDLQEDRRAASSAGSDIVFAPDAGEMYASDHVTYVHVDRLTEVLEGMHRPEHFRGVTTVVAKLLNIVKPHTAVFGQKDAQQVAVIRRMVSDLNFGIDIVVGPTVREPDGLAMSSRNAYLSPVQRREAAVLYQALQHADERIRGGERSAAEIVGEMKERIVSRSSGSIDYISISDEESLEELSTVQHERGVLVSLAVRFGSTRLIDNIVARS
jgi:pantoate--beta-alanine ligase